MWLQKNILLKARSRGFHLVTDEVLRALPEINRIKAGLCHLCLQHTSASLTLNENADPSVRSDFESFFKRLVPDNNPLYVHIYEGLDDITAHLKSSILGVTLLLPVTNGKFNLGTWQGIYLGEHREQAGQRKIIITLQGEDQV